MPFCYEQTSPPPYLCTAGGLPLRAQFVRSETFFPIPDKVECKKVPSVQNEIIHRWLKETENKFDLKIDKYIIMPNHLHMIVTITERHAGRSLQDVMRWFKTMTVNEYIKRVKEGTLQPFDKKLWQKSYHDHIIRNEKDYQKIWEYIDTNAVRWENDCFYTPQILGNRKK